MAKLRKLGSALYERSPFVRDSADLVGFYVKRVIPRAFKDTVALVWRHWRKEVLVAVLLVGAALVTGEDEQTTGDLEATLVLLLLIAAGAAILVFVIEFFMAPVKFEREHEERVEAMKREFFAALTKRKVLFGTQQDMTRAALPVASELKDVRKMAEMYIDANSGEVATPYRSGFQFPRSKWDEWGQQLTPDKDLYATVEAAYAEMHRANEIIAWRESQATGPFAMGEDDDLEAVRDTATTALEAIEKASVREDLGQGVARREPVPLRVTRGRYGIGDNQADVTNRLNELIVGGVLDFIADDATLTFGEDPAPGEKKSLIVEFEVGYTSDSIAFDEGTHVRLP